MLWVRISLSDLQAGQWFSLGMPVSFTNKTDHEYINDSNIVDRWQICPLIFTHDNFCCQATSVILTYYCWFLMCDSMMLYIDVTVISNVWLWRYILMSLWFLMCDSMMLYIDVTVISNVWLYDVIYWCHCDF